MVAAIIRKHSSKDGEKSQKVVGDSDQKEPVEETADEPGEGGEEEQPVEDDAVDVN